MHNFLQKNWESIVAVVIVILALGWVVGSLTYSHADQQSRASGMFLGKVIRITQDEEPYEFSFLVTSVSASGTLFPWWWGTIYLDGRLLLDQPEGAQYLGLAQGSTIVNWQKPNGKGSTWIIKDTNVHVVDPPIEAFVNIHVTNAIVK